MGQPIGVKLSGVGDSAGKYTSSRAKWNTLEHFTMISFTAAFPPPAFPPGITIEPLLCGLTNLAAKYKQARAVVKIFQIKTKERLCGWYCRHELEPCLGKTVSLYLYQGCIAPTNCKSSRRVSSRNPSKWSGPRRNNCCCLGARKIRKST